MCIFIGRVYKKKLCPTAGMRNKKKRLCGKPPGDFHVFVVASDLVYRGLHNECAVREGRKRQDIANRRLAKRSQSQVLVAVEVRADSAFHII